VTPDEPTVLTDAEIKALNALDETAMANHLLELLAVPSVTGADAESALQHRLADRLRELDLDVDLWSMDLAALQAHADFPGLEAPRGEAWGLVGHSAGTDGPTLILQGHVDVVPPGDRAKWVGDPFVPRVVGDEIHGRGACDMKGGLVAILGAVAALRASRVPLSGRLAVHCVVSEEDGGLGAFGTLHRGHTGDACIIAEPTGGTLISANAGALTFRIEVPGLATHGSTRYAGVSAIDAFLPIYRELAELERHRNQADEPLMADWPVPYPISIGTIRSGDWASTVPDLLVAEGRLGVRLDEDPAEARRALEEAVAAACATDAWLREHPATVSWPGGQFASGRLPAGDPLRDLVGHAHAAANRSAPPRERGAPYGSDLRLYSAAGIPTLQYGPGDVRLAHSPREMVPFSEVVAVARTLIVATLRALNPPRP
jgi:acetylornithine deacetylase